MTAVPLDLIIGPQRAGQFIQERIEQLVTADCLPEARATDMVCTAVLDSDPWVLADPGQTWIPRDTDGQEREDLPPDLLYVAQRHGAVVLVEDEWAQREWLPVSVLHDYVLNTWHWARQESPTEG